MPYTTKEEKEAALQILNRFIQAGHKLTIQQYQRLSMWLNGMTFREIAAEMGVSQQAVAQSVRRDVKKLQAFGNQHAFSNEVAKAKDNR